jgi:hypothetical protein
MARKPINKTARLEFARLLDNHLKEGQNCDRPENKWKPWMNEDFAGVTGASPNSVANWRNQVAPIPPRDVHPLLDALFGEKPEYRKARLDLHGAWEHAQGLMPSEAVATGAWEPVETYKPTGLAAVTLHDPAPANRTETYHLHASIRFGAVEISDEQERTAIVTLTEASAAIQGEGYQVAQNSLIGERAAHPHCTPNGEEIRFTGPTGSGTAHLSGNPLGEDHIATIEPGATADQPGVGVTLVASPRHLRFAFAADPDAPPAAREEKPNRAAILGLLFADGMRKDAANRVVLASARLRRKEEP